MDYSSLARKYGTPLYVYDFNEIQKNFIALKEAFAARKSLVCFAIKANSNLSVLKFLSAQRAIRSYFRASASKTASSSLR